MQELWASLAASGSSPALALVLALLCLALGAVGVLSVPLTWILYLTGRSYRELRYTASSQTVMDEPYMEVPGLQVRYDGTLLARLTLTRVEIWNAGTEPIGTSGATANPLRIVVPGQAQVVGSTVLSETGRGSQLAIGEPEETEAGMAIPLSFDLLDAEQGATIQVLHNATEDLAVRVDGSIKGVKGPTPVARRDRDRAGLRQWLPAVGVSVGVVDLALLVVLLLLVPDLGSRAGLLLLLGGAIAVVGNGVVLVAPGRGGGA